MADRNHSESERDAEDTDERLYTDPHHKISLCGFDDLSLKRDHCDLLLDAIDAQLGQLQVQSPKHQMVSKETDPSAAAHLRWSHSVSKDTGLGSTRSNDTTMSSLDLIHAPTVRHSSETSWESLLANGETTNRLNRQAKGKEEMESRTEQVIWRLEKLLGDACSEDGLAREMQPPSDSICTEDFHRCFREEMVEPALSETNMHQLDIEEAEGVEVTDSDNDQSEQKRHVFNFERGGLAMMGKSSKITMSAHYSQSDMPHQRKEPEKYLSDGYGINVSHVSEKAGARERYKLPQRSDDNTGRWNTLIQCVTSLDDHFTNYCNSDTSKQEESEPLDHRCTNRNIQDRRFSVHKVQYKKKELSRLRCSSGDNDKDTDEEINLWNRGRQTEWELERLAADTAQMEKEKQTVECVLTDSREERDSISCQLEKLPKQRESFVFETENEVETLCQHKQTVTAGSCKERNLIIMSALEREEMERQLDNTKTELFAEQRRAREELESMQEKLEETFELLQRATGAETSLRETCACLEEKRKQKKEQLEAAETRVTELQVELGEYNIRLGSLEKLLAQKELQLIDFQEQCGALQADRDKLKVELQRLKTSYYKTLKEAQERAYRMTVNQQAKEGKVSGLKEETTCLAQHIESLQRSVQLKEEEAVQLRKSLEQQREEAKDREKQLHLEALEKVHKAVDEERRKWEAEKVEAVHVHCRILEEQNGKSLEKMRSEMQREKSKALAFQEQVLKLKTKAQELESERCAQQREQESLLAGICKSLKEEHQAQLHRLQKDMAEESQRKVLRIQQAIQLAEEEAGRLRVMLEEKDSSHHQIQAELDQQLRAWTQELGTECQHLHLLVEQCGAKQKALHLPLNPTVAEALANLRTLREHLKHLISHLQQELDSQKQTSQQLRKDKARELSIQRQQLRVERDQALGFLKEQLILEHIEELSRLNVVRMGGGRADGGVAESLHKQLKAKDLELRQVQKSTGQWREQTAARLASRFEEDLRAELQRKASDVQREGQKLRDGTEGKMTFNAKEAQISLCSSSLCAVDSAASYRPSDVSSFKLLHYLQSKVKQLRAENQAYSCSSALSNSDLTTIQGGDSAGIRSQSSINAPSS